MEQRASEIHRLTLVMMTIPKRSRLVRAPAALRRRLSELFVMLWSTIAAPQVA